MENKVAPTQLVCLVRELMNFRLAYSRKFNATALLVQLISRSDRERNIKSSHGEPDIPLTHGNKIIVL